MRRTAPLFIARHPARATSRVCRGAVLSAALLALGGCGAPTVATPADVPGPTSPLTPTEAESLGDLPGPSAPVSRPTPSDVALLTQAPGLRITLLANAGFLLQSDEAAVLIDAFVTEPHSIYGALTASTAGDLLAARPPFDDVSLALTSHVHRDHVQAEAAREFLAASPGTQFVSTPEVIAAIEAGTSDGEVDRARLQPLLPPPGKSFHVTRRGVTVELLHLRHGDGPPAAVQNLGLVVTLGGARVIHLGDAAVDVDTLAAYAPADRGLDLALVPYWYLLDPDGRRLVERHLPARMVIACHVPPAERDALAAELARTLPDVIVPTGPLDSWILDPADR